MKILGVLLALAITGLSVENALTGHGIKGNKNLNPEILASGSSGGSGSSSGSGSGSVSCTSSWPGDCIGTANDKYYRKIVITDPVFDAPVQKGKEICQKYKITSKQSCDPGGTDDCTPGTWVNTGENCFTPD